MKDIAVWGFSWVPPFAQGLVRDLRVRWALEEAGLAYQSRWIGIEERNSDAYRRKHPFGMVPVLESADGALTRPASSAAWPTVRRSGGRSK